MLLHWNIFISVEPPANTYGKVHVEVVYVKNPTSFWVNFVNKLDELASINTAIRVCGNVTPVYLNNIGIR